MTLMTGSISPDGFYALYEPSFNPASPQTNCVTMDDSGPGLAPMMTVNLQAGRIYSIGDDPVLRRH